MAPYMRSIFVSFFVLGLLFSRSGLAASDCSCGYYDDSIKGRWTDSIIVYFNETDSVPGHDFLIQAYEKPYEKGWNTQFREGASLSNAVIGNSTDQQGNESQSLELWCNPTTPHHLVEGGGIKTQRQDIFFGTFRARMRGSQQSQGGSSMSMMAIFNETESWQMDNINQNTPDLAWVSMISHGEFPTRAKGINYTDLTNTTIDPWGFTEYRVDWSRDELRYYMDGQVQRSVTRRQDNALPQTPAPLYIKHWSTGNFYSTQGPPAARSMANVQWIRMFFNSSLTTEEDKKSLAVRCASSTTCSVDDYDLRGSTAYVTDATEVWEQVSVSGKLRIVPTVIAIISISISFFVLVFTFVRRVPWDRVNIKLGGKCKDQHNSPYSASVTLVGDESRGSSRMPSGVFSYANSNASTPWMSPHATRPSSPTGLPSKTGLASQKFNADIYSNLDIEPADSKGDLETRKALSSKGPIINIKPVLASPLETDNKQLGHSNDTSASNSTVGGSSISDKEHKEPQVTTTSESTGNKAAAGAQAGPPKERIDYLAGLLVLCSLLVTAIHFCLTFSNASINPGAFVHNESETWARKLVSTFFLNLNWIGLFLMTSTRFLVYSYLKNGNLKGLAEKAVGRPFRLLIPIAAIAMLEYFLMDTGATHWLEYLASVTWSTWPFTTVPSNFGVFVSEILQLAYLIPNAAPQITFNYCTGVLWTVPVQLQGSWTTILGVIMIREIKTPWKRFVFHAWCILIHWYALSWGTYFYSAILLTDLELTFKWKPWIHARPKLHWSLLSLFGCLCVGGLAIDFATQWTGVNYVAYEYSAHPDVATGMPIMIASELSYPQYFVPKLNGLIFSIGFQSWIEISPLLQKFFGSKFITFLHPHIFTIYLIHGFIWWSLGSTICVYLATKGIPYEVNVVIVAVCCYTTLLLSLPILTPIVETLGKNVTSNIWTHASKAPPKRRYTLYPFSKDLLNRNAAIVEPSAEELEKKTAELEKGKDMGTKVGVVEL